MDLRAAYETLRLKDKELLSLVFVERQNCSQAAAALHLTPQAVRQRLSRLLRRLRIAIDIYEEDLNR